MNEQDLRDCYAMLRAITGANAEECYMFADEMLEARKVKEVGIKAVKRTRKTNDEKD
jgi:methionine salvage enolase-phosphatase E1